MFIYYRILELLKQKYTDVNDFNFLEQGIRCNLQNYNNNLKLGEDIQREVDGLIMFI